MAITNTNLALQEPSTVTARVATVQIARGSTNEQQEILVLGDPESSLGMARVLASTPASTEYGLAVREIAQSTGPFAISSIAGPVTVTPVAGSTWNVRPVQSSQADLRVTVYQSTAADLLATVTPTAGSTWATRPLQSSAADLQMTATIGTNLQSTVAPSSGSSGLVVRPVIDTILTVASSNAFASSALSIQSSGAGIRSYVTAYSITSTDGTARKVAFYSSGTMTWPLVLAAVSSAISGANLAVSAPAYIFRTAASEALTLNTPSAIAGFKVGVSYFRAP